MQNFKKIKIIAQFTGFFLLFSTVNALAGVFDLASYVAPGLWSVGFEPEVIVSRPSGVGMNFKPRFGQSEIINWEGIIGLGSGNKNFRLGGTADFEWIPDVPGQPGFATPFTALYSRLEDVGQINYGFQPMIYNTFYGDTAVYTPFISVPLGWELREAKNRATVQMVMGSMFRPANSESWQFTAEAGFNIKGSYSYISGGVTYFQ